MKERILVSIITVVYNGEKYLQQTIDSVHNQTYKNIEYIIIDGGSTDNTINIIKHNQDKITKWISEPDQGLYDAMNKGVKLANGKLIGTINSDDWYELDIVELSVNAFKNNPNVRAIHSNRYDVFFDSHKKEFKFNPSSFKLKYLSMTYSHPSMFIIREEYQKHLYVLELKYHSDYQFILKIFLNNKNAFLYIPKPLVNFRQGGVSGQLNLIDDLREGFIARKSAGMKTVECVFALIIRVFIRVILEFKKL